MLTLAAEPEVVRADGLRCPVVALHFLPLSLHAPAAARAAAREYPGGLLSSFGAPSSLGQRRQSVVSQSVARARLALRPSGQS